METNKLHDFFNHKSDANKYLTASQQEDLEKDFESWTNSADVNTTSIAIKITLPFLLSIILFAVISCFMPSYSGYYKYLGLILVIGILVSILFWHIILQKHN
jgi:hypothetical protein